MRLLGHRVLVAERDDAREIAAEREHAQIEHLLDAIAYVAGRPWARTNSARLAGALDADLELAHAGEVFIELRVVVLSELALETTRVVTHRIEDAEPERAALQ